MSSSLVTYASPWMSDDNQPRKRQPTMRKTIKMRPIIQSSEEPEEYVSQAENYQNLQPSTFDDIQQSNNERSSKVNELLNKITAADNTENSKMGAFNPISPPSMNVKKDMGEDKNIMTINDLLPSKNGQQSLPSSVNYHGNYSGDEIKSPVYSNYVKSYEPPTKLPNPYYAKLGINSSAPPDERLIEKMNYMIHLLEQQQSEKTNNITEEFILYTMLGVFIIYIVDSFARSGKYVR